MENLYNWVRADGPTVQKQRIQHLKTLKASSDTSDNKPTKDGLRCQILVVEALLNYAKGKEGAKVFPYGDRASKKTADFLAVPSPTFSVTLACMYPFIAEDKETHAAILKRSQYPIKQLWPRSILRRYLNSNDVFFEQRDNIFAHYEESGGDYHGEDVTSSEEDMVVEEKEYEDLTLQCDKDF